VETEEEKDVQENAIAEPAAEPAVAPAEPAPVVAQARTGGVLVWLALLLALLLAAAALGLSGWMYQRGLQEDTGLETRLQTRLQAMGQDVTASGQRLQQELARSARELDAKFASQLTQVQQAQRQQLDSLQSALQNQRQQLLELRSTDRSDWSLAEAEYLVRLAHQRLLLAADVRSALALLVSADSIVQELDDAELHPLRSALASDIAALRAVPEFDLEGSWLRIRAIANQIDNLMLFKLPKRAVPPSQSAPAADWQGRLEHGLQAAATRLSNYLVIRRRETPYQPLMDPQWEQLVRQNLRMLLEQGQTALLAGNEVLYQQSLMSARRWVKEFFAFDEAGVVALEKELEALQGLAISREYPEVTASLTAVKTAVNLRHNTAEGG
jgi:uroporphyrin-3 C-methyltransferase